MSFRSLGVWRVYFCLFSGGQQRRELSNLLGSWSSSGKKWWRDIFKREMCDTEYKVSTKWRHNGDPAATAASSENVYHSVNWLRDTLYRELLGYFKCIQKMSLRDQFQLTQAKTGIRGKKKKWRTFENHGICFLFFSISSDANWMVSREEASTEAYQKKIDRSMPLVKIPLACSS